MSVAIGLRAACAVLVGLAALPPGVASAQGPARDPEPRYEFEAFVRVRAETRSGGGENPAREDGFATSRLRLNATLRPAKNVRFFAQAQDSRVGGLALERNTRPLTDPVDLRQGYVALGSEDGPLTLYAGRRELAFIDQRLLGYRNWSNVAPTWDGALLTLRRGDYGLHLLGFSQVDIRDGVDPTSRTRFVYGAVGSIEAWEDGHQIEPLILNTRRPPDMRSSLGGLLRTAGSRFSGVFAETWDYQVILAGQGGGHRDRPQRAWMGVWAVGKTLEHARARPRLAVEWSYASGDSNPQDDRIGTFDTLFPSIHRVFGEMDLTGFRNLQALKTGIELHPGRQWTVSADFLDFRLASVHDGLYQTNSKLRIAAPLGGAGSAAVGSELDLVVRYSPVPRVELRVGLSRFMAGRFVTQNLLGGESQTFLNTTLQVRL